MKLSWKWLSELVDLKAVASPEALARLLTSRGLEVEEIHPQGKGLEKVVTARILERGPHPQADRLSLCKVSLGSGEPLMIVCGARNMKAGDIVALAQVGAHLPNDMKIAVGKIRGETSHGMLCSETELKLDRPAGAGGPSDGILILPPSTPLGVPLAQVLGLDDVILTLKLTANRGDCLSHFGLAREVAAALGVQPRMPAAWPVEKIASGKCPIKIELEAGSDAPQFHGFFIEGVKIAPSPAWLTKRLESLGSRSINNVVDATNLVMLELGQPLHAYDADRVEGARISVRLGREGEELPLLDGATVKLAGTELVIADGKRAVGLAGVMGGGNSEVSDSTRNVFLEAAEFNPSLVRRAAQKHQRRTDASHRFERGIDPRGVARAMGRLIHLVLELAGGTPVGGASVVHESRAKATPRKISVSPQFILDFLGFTDAAGKPIAGVTEADVERVFKAEGCVIEKGSTAWTVTPPSHRLDLNIREDLAEEVARSVGYDKIPATIPLLTSQPLARAADPSLARATLLDRIKDSLARSGLQEGLNFSFTHRSWLEKFGYAGGVKVLNPLSEDLEVMVPSLLPGLVRNVQENERRHFGSDPIAIRIFEVRPTFHAPAGAIAAKGETETGVEERWKLAFVLSGPRYAGGLKRDLEPVDFYDGKAVLDELFATLGAKGVRYSAASQSRTPDEVPVKLLHAGQGVEILAGNRVAGVFGLLHPGISRDLKLRSPVWVGEIDLDAVLKLSRPAGREKAYQPWGEFPGMERDFALVVGKDQSAEKITQIALKAGKPLAKVAKVFDTYEGTQVPEGKISIAVRVIFLDEGRSLQEAETEAAAKQIVEAFKKDLGADLRG